MKTAKRILVAPLNWGLGHATRCIPIIRELQSCGYRVVLASDGQAKELLEKEFPDLDVLALPSYNVKYAVDEGSFTRKLLSQTPKIWKAIRAEHRLLKEIISIHNIDGVISDNRLGLYTQKVPCVIITHQLQVLSGKTTWFSSTLHQSFLKRFTECWVPDYNNEQNLSGDLSRLEKPSFPIKYIGPLSRFKKSTTERKAYAITAIVSGPEPQRAIFEQLLHRTLKKYNGKSLLVKGNISSEQEWESDGLCTTVNYLTSNELEDVINSSDFIIARSGYSTIMDMAKLEKKAFFVPTPGQPEQEYLASYVKEKKIAPFTSQENFSLKKLSQLKVYSGFEKLDKVAHPDLRDFFSLFESKGELRSHSKFAFNIQFLLVSFYNMFNNRKAESRS